MNTTSHDSSQATVLACVAASGCVGAYPNSWQDRRRCDTGRAAGVRPAIGHEGKPIRQGPAAIRVSNSPDPLTRLLDGHHHLERFAMEQTGEVDYLITWRDELVGRVSLTPCVVRVRIDGASHSRSSLRASGCAYTSPPSLSRRSSVRAAPPQTHQRITNLGAPNEAHGCLNAHAMPRRHCTSPGFKLARTTLR